MSNLQKIADIEPSKENGWKKRVLIRCDEEWDEEDWEQHLVTQGFLDAMDSGDRKEIKRFVRKMKFPACSLMATKSSLARTTFERKGSTPRRPMPSMVPAGWTGMMASRKLTWRGSSHDRNASK